MADKKNWVQESVERMHKKGSEGSMTRIAKRMGKTPLEGARSIMAHKESHSPAEIKKANWLVNINK